MTRALHSLLTPILLALTITGAPGRGSAQSTPAIRYDIRPHGISIEIPGSWTAVEQDLLRAISQQASDIMGMPLEYAAGFHIGETGPGLDFPYALMQVHDLGRAVSDEEMVAAVEAEAETVTRMVESALDKISFLEDTKLGEPIWDPARKIVWTKSAVTRADGVQFYYLTSMNTYARGAVNLHIYVLTEEELPAAEAWSAQIVESMTYSSKSASIGLTRRSGSGHVSVQEFDRNLRHMGKVDIGRHHS